MPVEQFQAELDYAAVMLLTREMLTEGVISSKDFSEIERLFVEQFQPMFGMK